MCTPTISNSFSWVYSLAIAKPTNIWYEKATSTQTESSSDFLSLSSFKPIPEALEKQLKKNHEYKARSDAIKSRLDTLKKVQFFSRERLQGKFLFRSQTGQEFQLKRGKVFLLERKSIFVIDEEVFLSQKAKQVLLKVGQDFLLDKGRVFLSQIGEIFIKNKEVFLIEKGKSIPLPRNEASLPRNREIFLSEQGEVFLERQGTIFHSTRETFFYPNKNIFFRSNRVKGFLSEEKREASLEGAVKKLLINFLIKAINLIEENTKNNKQIASLEEQIRKCANKNQDKDLIKQRSLKKMIKSCKEENDRYQAWMGNALLVQNFLESSIFFNPKQLLGKLVKDNGDLKIDKERKIEIMKSLEKQLEQITQKDI